MKLETYLFRYVLLVMFVISASYVGFKTYFFVIDFIIENKVKVECLK